MRLASSYTLWHLLRRKITMQIRKTWIALKPSIALILQWKDARQNSSESLGSILTLVIPSSRNSWKPQVCLKKKLVANFGLLSQFWRIIFTQIPLLLLFLFHQGSFVIVNPSNMLYSEYNTTHRVIWWDDIDKSMQQTSVLLTHLLIHVDLAASNLLTLKQYLPINSLQISQFLWKVENIKMIISHLHPYKISLFLGKKEGCTLVHRIP